MKLHGLVCLVVLAIVWRANAQEAAVPRPLGSLDPTVSPALDAVPVPSNSVPTSRGTSLEQELRALRQDLQTFHALSAEVAHSARAVETDSDRVSSQQRKELLDLLTKLAIHEISKNELTRKTSAASDERPVPAVPVVPTLPPIPEEPVSPPITDAAVDPFALGKNLFRLGDYEKAEAAFRKVTPTEENRLLLKYLVATCLRKRSQWQPAIDGYREIAESNSDPVLRDLAKWQLESIRWNQQTESQLEHLRQQRSKSAEPARKTPEQRTSTTP